jgi:hypothetical protein
VVQVSPDAAEQFPSPQGEQAPQSSAHDSQDSRPDSSSHVPFPHTGHSPQSDGQFSQTSSSSWLQTPSPHVVGIAPGFAVSVDSPPHPLDELATETRSPSTPISALTGMSRKRSMWFD